MSSIDNSDADFSKLLEELSKSLKRLRDTKGWSVEDLADRAGLHRTHVYAIERAKGNVTLKSLAKLAMALEIELYDLLASATINNTTSTTNSSARDSAGDPSVVSIVLLIEDSQADAFLVRRCISNLFPFCSLTVEREPDKAIEYLKTENSTSLPELILLDLNLPKIDGHEFLSIIKSDNKLRRIPVVILTTSPYTRDVELAYNHHANSYVTKSTSLERFTQDLEMIVRYWCTTSRSC